MHPGPGQRDQRATRSRSYVRRPSTRCPAELWGPGEPGRCSVSAPSSSLGAVDSSLLWGTEGTLDGLDLSSRERNLSRHLVESLVSGYAIHLRVNLTEKEGDTFMGALGIDRMEDCPVVEITGDMEVLDAEFECRD